MKKVISLILSLVLLLSTVVVSQAAGTADYDLDMFKNYSDVLVSLEIADSKLLERPADDFVSNREFANLVSNIVGEVDLARYSINSSMTDRSITYDMALKIMIDVMGYNPGGNFKSYLLRARELGLNSNMIKKSGNIELYDVVVLLYNCLDAEMYLPVYFQEEDLVRYEKTGRTVAQICCDAVYFEGVLVSNRYGSIEASVGGNDTDIYIKTKNGILRYDDCEMDTFGLLGHRVEGFRKDGDINDLIALFPAENRVLTLNYKNQPKISGSVIRYTEESGRVRDVKINYKASFLVNGEPTDTIDVFKAAMVDAPGKIFEKIDLIDNNDDKVYDVISLVRYQNVIVDYVSKKDMSVIDIYGKGIDYTSKFDDKLLDIKTVDGKDIAVKDIKNKSVLSIIENPFEKKAVRMIVTEKMETGKISSISNDEPKQFKVQLENSKDVATVDVVDCSYTEKAVMGILYDFLYDYTGRIAATDKNQGISNDGVFVMLRAAEEDAFFDGIELLMYGDLRASSTDEATEPVAPSLKVYKVKRNARCDGTKIAIEDIDELNKKLFHTIVSYDTNANGEITKIRTSDVDEVGNDYESLNRHSALENADTKVDTTKLMYIYENGFVGFRNTPTNINAGAAANAMPLINSSKGLNTPYENLKLISIPDITMSEASADMSDHYAVIDIENREQYISEETAKYKVEGYFGKDELIPSYILYIQDTDYEPSATTELVSRTDVLLVGSVTTTLNPYTEQPCKRIMGLYRGKEREFFTSDEDILNYGTGDKYLEAATGDAYFVNFDANGCIRYGLRFYDYNDDEKTGEVDAIVKAGSYVVTEGTMTGAETITDYINHKIFVGDVYNVARNNTAIYIIPDKTEENLNTARLSKLGFPGVNRDYHVYVYDTMKRADEGRIKIGTYADAATYINSRDKASRAVIRSRNGYCTDVILYK